MAAPSRIRIPISAPRPVPTISAVGVANPKAQGQEITNTAIAAIIANSVGDRNGSTQGRCPAKTFNTAAIGSGKIIQTIKVMDANTSILGTK